MNFKLTLNSHDIHRKGFSTYTSPGWNNSMAKSVPNTVLNDVHDLHPNERYFIAKDGWTLHNEWLISLVKKEV